MELEHTDCILDVLTQGSLLLKAYTSLASHAMPVVVHIAVTHLVCESIREDLSSMKVLREEFLPVLYDLRGAAFGPAPPGVDDKELREMQEGVAGLLPQKRKRAQAPTAKSKIIKYPKPDGGEESEQSSEWSEQDSEPDVSPDLLRGISEAEKKARVEKFHWAARGAIMRFHFSWSSRPTGGSKNLKHLDFRAPGPQQSYSLDFRAPGPQQSDFDPDTLDFRIFHIKISVLGLGSLPGPGPGLEEDCPGPETCNSSTGHDTSRLEPRLARPSPRLARPSPGQRSNQRPSPGQRPSQSQQQPA